MVGYGIVKKSPGKPISNIIQTVTKPSYTIENAPSDSISGTITALNGNVDFQSRIATEAATISIPYPAIEQGEMLQTEENATTAVTFRDTAAIQIDPKTEIDFVQTLPINFVLSQASGSALIKKTGSVPISIRALHLLVKQNSGELGIGVDTDNGLVNLNIVTGSVTVAYNDTELVSHEFDLASGKRFTFNDLTRTFDF